MFPGPVRTESEETRTIPSAWIFVVKCHLRLTIQNIYLSGIQSAHREERDTTSNICQPVVDTSKYVAYISETVSELTDCSSGT